MMFFRRAILVLVVAARALLAALPTPEEHLGFQPGADYKLAGNIEITGYFEKLAAVSDRMQLVEFGRSSGGRPMFLAIISSPENLQKLDRLREGNRKLALGQAAGEEAERLVAEGRTFVWIDSGLHSTEVAPSQHAPELAYAMVSGESEEIRRIRANVILLQVPVINPDGLDMVVDWYKGNVGTQHEIASLPFLYQKYAGHDNNRDYFMMNLQETRHVTRLLYREWFPQIVYNQHQAPPFPARIFVPPYAEPLNPNIPAAVMEGINLIGSTMKERFAREDKPGVLSYWGFDAWWDGGLRSTPAFHNMHGILTETAAHVYGTPKTYSASDFPERFGNGISTRTPSVFYQQPWMGGKWGVREAIEYMLTADMAILELAATRRAEFLQKAYDLARASIEQGRQGGPYAYVLPPDQWDRSSALEFLHRLQLAGVEVKQAEAPFQANGETYPEGSYVLLASQPFRPYLIDLLERQVYPEVRAGESGGVKKPYDIAGWTLSLQMGVQTVRVETPFDAVLTPVADIQPATDSLDHRENASFRTTVKLLQEGKRVRWDTEGAILAEDQANPALFATARYELRMPRVALYEPWVPNMDAGWTQWLLDYYNVPYTLIHNEDFQDPGLGSRFDTILFASQAAHSILNGSRHGEYPHTESVTLNKDDLNKAFQRAEYSGGIGIPGLENLFEFVRQGGWLIALNDAVELPLQFFPLPVRDSVSRSTNGTRVTFASPGSLLRIQVDPTHPIAFGMPSEAIAFSTGGHAFDVMLAPAFNHGNREVHSVARYVDRDLLASGWLDGEKAVLGREILVEARHGEGRVVLFGFRPQFRGQPFGTFKLLLNAVFLASAETLEPIIPASSNRNRRHSNPIFGYRR